MFLFVSLLFLASCSEDENEDINQSQEYTVEFNGKSYTEDELQNEAKNITDQDISRMLSNHFGITEVNKLENNNNNRLQLNGDYSVTEYVFGDSNKRIYLAQNSNQKDEYRVIQGNFINSTLDIYSDKTVDYASIKQNSQRFGNPSIDGPDGAVLDGPGDGDTIDGPGNGDIINPGGAEETITSDGWCQQEGNETPSQCEDREYDEFVDDCIACWIAYHTHPAIPILISATCLC